jgi:hypothetical protein
MTRRILSVLLLLAGAPALAQVGMGRLFATPAERSAMEAHRGAAGAAAPGAAPAVPPDDAAPGAAAAPPPETSTLEMNGILRRSDKRATVWLNGEPQAGAQRSVAQQRGAVTPEVTVTLPSGKKLKLKAGQRYDLDEGRIKDVHEP